MKTNVYKLIGFLMFGIFSLTACSQNMIQGSGNVVTESRDVSGFNSVSISGIGRVIITQVDKEALTIEADDNIMEHITSEVSDGTLILGYKEDLSLESASPVVFRVNLKNLISLDNAGTASFEVDKVNTDQLQITKSGTGDIKIIELNAKDINVSAEGTGKIELGGSVENQEVDLLGTVEYHAPDVKSQNANVSVDGTANAFVWVLDSLDVVINGSGEVHYYGSPSVTQDISGTGSLTHLGSK